MNITFGTATEVDISELIRLRLLYIKEDFGAISERERECMKKQLYDYFSRKLGTELIAFVARDGERIVSTAYLLIIEMPANPNMLSGLCGEVLSVFTEPSYRGKGLCTQLMKNLIECAKKRGLFRIDLSATAEGFPIYEKFGFKEKQNHYRDMRIVLYTMEHR